MINFNNAFEKDFMNKRYDKAEGFSRGARTLIFVPMLKRGETRLLEAKTEEAKGLARAIELNIVHVSSLNLSEIRPNTYIGMGKVAELAAIVVEKQVELVVADCKLSPVQQRNLEEELKVKVIDRTGLILEIFGRRAKTNEGRLQVELAHLNYQKSRLVRSWTHLERQRGGFGFLGGPGETQIEVDRRLIFDRIRKIEKDLAIVKRTRRLHRAGRKRVPWAVVALVGYTNAGKSTLFNSLTRSDVLAKDMLFATLDPTLRLVRLPNGTKIILSDTVGFISDLPTELVAAFRATLEEVLEADIILHIRDISHEESDNQAKDVRAILADLEIEQGDSRLIEVWNKIDNFTPEMLLEVSQKQAATQGGEFILQISALNGEGLPFLLESLEHRLTSEMIERELIINDAAQLNWIYENFDVLTREDLENGTVKIKVKGSKEKIERL